MKEFVGQTVAVVLLVTACAPSPASEQFLMGEAARRTEEGLPPVTIKRPADFLVLNVRMENDSRDDKQREQEVYATILNLVKAAEDAKNIQLHSGVDTITSGTHKISLSKAGDRPDTSQAAIFVKVPLSADADVPKLTERLRKFVSDAKLDGRTQLFPGDVGLSVVDAEKYRYELLEAIAKDIKKVSELFGDAYKFSVSGLDARIRIRRTGIKEVELYIQYSFSMSSK